MRAEVEYPIYTLFSLLIWAAKNWLVRSVNEELMWEERVLRFGAELIGYLKEEERYEKRSSK